MGLLEELILLIKEGIEDANERNRRAKQPAADVSAPAERSPEEIEALRRALARRAAEQRVAQERAEAEQQAQREERQRAEERKRQQQARRQAPPPGVVHGATDQRRIVRLLRQPQTLRELVVLREILDRPVALRGGRRR
jgi:hypothetical protein